jgi:hypothetical protein
MPTQASIMPGTCKSYKKKKLKTAQFYANDNDRSKKAYLNVWAGEHLLDSRLHSSGVGQA